MPKLLFLTKVVGRSLLIIRSSIQLSMISLHQLSIYRGNQEVLSNINFAIERGEHSIFTGDNGVGKTSLLATITGRLPARRGRIDFSVNLQGGESIFDWKRTHVKSVSFTDDHRKFLQKARYYQQRFHAFDADGLTVETYLKSLGYDAESKADQQLINEAELTELLPVSRVKLSSGQSRKLLIAAALLSRPRLLLLDNPFVGLDESNRQLVNQLLDKVAQQQDITMLLAGFYTQLPSCVSTEIRLTKTMAVKMQPAIGRQPLMNRQAHIDQNIIDYFKEVNHWPSFKTCLALDKVSIGYPDIQILQDLSLSIEKGEKWAVHGQNGAGKSTLIGLISADHPQAYQNSLLLFDQPRGAEQNIWDIKQQIGFLSSELHAYFHDPTWTCYEIVKQGFYVTIYNRQQLPPEKMRMIDLLFAYFQKSDIKKKRFNQCSAGEQRVVLFMRAIIKNPPLLLLDEPFQCLDPKLAAKAKHLVESVLTSHHTLIFISHYQHEIPNTITHHYHLTEPI